jgi:regulator of protease activity HflC (stomatin/prohibitin superfamily)
MAYVVGILFLFLSLISLSSCEKVPAGNVGIVVHMLGSEKGVDSEEVGVGRKWVGFNDELYLFPTYTQNDTWQKNDFKDQSITFQTKEGMEVRADIGISYHIDPKRVSVVFQKYRKGIDEISDIYLRNMVQDSLVKAASTREVETIYGSGKAELLSIVEREVKEQVEPIGIVIEHLYWVGKLYLPTSIIDAINKKSLASQTTAQRESEVQQVKAEADKERERARGVADATRLAAEAEANNIRIKGEAEAAAIEAKTRALSQNPQFVQYEVATRWDGRLPGTTFGSNSIPMIQLPH